MKLVVILILLKRNVFYHDKYVRIET